MSQRFEKRALSWEGPNSLASYYNDSMAEIPEEAIMPARVGGMLGSLILGAYLQKAMAKDLKSLKKSDPRNIKRILQHFKLKNLPVVEYPRLDNAAYIEPSSFQKGLFSEGLHREDSHLRKTIGQDPKVIENLRRHGLVIYDKKFATPAIIAHEAGHADIGNMPWYAPSNINQKYLRGFSDLAGRLGAPLAGLAVGAMTRNPFLGIGAGALTGALINSPTLINEWQATHRANKYLDQKMMNQKEREKSRKALNSAYNTYLAGATLIPAVMGGVAGGFANNASARDIFGRLKQQTA